MIFKQFFLEALGHASYLIGSEETGEAFVLDVRRDVEQYYDFAREQGLTIRYASDTHQHNDYLTGITELKQRSPVELLAGARAELGYSARKMDDGARLKIGEIELEVLHTPGHTPEHISFLVRDFARGDEPLMLLSGGALLVDDVARPDLLGKESETRQGALDLGRTLKEKILTLPDHVLVYPTHVAGSLCGGNIGSMLVTTVGYEKRLNELLRCVDNEEEFGKRCMDLENLPTVPPYWRRMRKQNQQGPEALGVLKNPPALSVDEFARRRDDGALVLDCRQPEAFGGGHIPGSLNVGFGTSFPTWAGSVLPIDRPVLVLLDRPDDLWEVSWHLLRIGYELPAGWLAGGIMAWRVAGREIDRVAQWTVDELDERRSADIGLLILDVRQPAEWAEGHVPGARHVSGGELAQKVGDLPRDRPIAVYCGSGFRSSVATSLLKADGRDLVFNVLGGYTAWMARDLPVEGVGVGPS
ncbi:MAG: rhodanese-like domain-containing protein [Xanthomonadales bacterium]|nr:rhodanese-like domain-containing protein [Xanthomonadales bacterium]